MGSTPYLGGGFGHFYAYAPVKIKYAIDRFSMEVKRQLDVLDRQLADNQFIAGNEYTIADMASGRGTAMAW
jgi:GSH-dependent disulfide-bond oxidoreductase